MKIQRVQTGVRIEKRLLKVLKTMAEYHEMSLGDLLEGIVLHAMDGKLPFNEESRTKIDQIKALYGMDYGSEASHKMVEEDDTE